MEDELALSQETSAQISAADRKRTESTDGADASNMQAVGEKLCVPSTWWAALFVQGRKDSAWLQPPAARSTFECGLRVHRLLDRILRAEGGRLQFRASTVTFLTDLRLFCDIVAGVVGQAKVAMIKMLQLPTIAFVSCVTVVLVLGLWPS